MRQWSNELWAGWCTVGKGRMSSFQNRVHKWRVFWGCRVNRVQSGSIWHCVVCFGFSKSNISARFAKSIQKRRYVFCRWPTKPKQTTQCQIDPLGMLFTLQPEKMRHLWERFWKLDILPFPTVHQPAHYSFVLRHTSSANRRCFPYVKPCSAKNPFK